MSNIPITSALISVFDKSGLEVLVKILSSLKVKIYSTGGTYDFIKNLGVDATLVEDLTGYPSMLDGRVKTLHPAVFAGILAKRDDDHLGQLEHHQLPQIDLVVVDLYPFEETLRNTDDDKIIIEKIDIGGVSLLRAAAKNHAHVAVISKQEQYPVVASWLESQDGETSLDQRTSLAYESFVITSQYDTAISNYFASKTGNARTLRYGENPHQSASFIGNINNIFEQISGKEISYNNLVDVDAAISLINEFKENKPTFAIIKHTNPCGIASRETVSSAWDAALACDPTSAFGGILICNHEIDLPTANSIDEIFYEVLIAPSYATGVADLLRKKKNRIILKLNSFEPATDQKKHILGGQLVQGIDSMKAENEVFQKVTKASIPETQTPDLLFAIKCVKHLKSNAIAIVKNEQMIGAGLGQTSRIDALNQAVAKAGRMGFDLTGSVLSSDAFFPFADSVAITHEAGIKAIIQPGGSVKDNDSIAYCDENNIAMYFTGIRHFKH